MDEMTPEVGVPSTVTTEAPSDWRSSLPAELASEPALGKYKSVDEAMKGLVNAQRLIGKAEYPGKEATPESIADYRKRAGVPDSVEKYGVTMPKAPEGQEWDQTKISGFLQAMHSTHARPEQVQAALDFFVGYMASEADRSRITQAQASIEETQTGIRKLEEKWGPLNGPVWQQNKTRVLGAIETLTDDPEERKLLDDLSQKHPGIAAKLAEIGKGMQETGFLGEDEMAAGDTYDEAQRQADAMRDAWAKDPNHILNHPTHPEYERTMRRYENLLRRSVPQGHVEVANVRR